MIKIHTFPLFAIRQFYLTIRSFQKALNDVIQSRRAVHAMNHLFPLASADELTTGDATCIICREEMTVESGAKKLPCNHIFHPNCLRSWFQRQQTCPTCRTDILAQRRPNIVPGQNGNQQQQVNNLMMQQQPQNGQQMPPLFAQILGQLQQQRNAQAPNGQQQQQQGPAPQLFPFMAHNFAFAQQPFMQPQQQQQQNQTEGNAATGAAATFPPTMPMPPLPFPGMLPMPPLNGASPFPFPQPPVFAGLSDEEISQMEGNQRAAIEARLQALSNISVLLDAAVLQFQQYLSISNAVGGLQPPPAAAASSSSTSFVSASSSTVPEQNIDTTATLPNDAPTSSTASTRLSQQPNGHIHNSTLSSSTATSNIPHENDSPTDISPEEHEHQETIRRRRLQYFDGNN